MDENWIFESILSNYLYRVKIVIHGTKETQYLQGDYEGKAGRILAAQENPDAFEQTARVRFEDGEERSIAAKYIVPQDPKNSLRGEEVLILAGKQRGRALVIRGDRDDDELVVSSKQDPSNVDKVSKSFVVPLADEPVSSGGWQ